jgi:hypothetical protein
MTEKEEKKIRQSAEKGKVFVVLLITGILGILVGLGWGFRQKIITAFKTLRTSVKKVTGTASGVEEKKVTGFKFEWGLWDDPAGFSFEYPKELEVDVHQKDEVNYSFLTLAKKNQKGKIVVICTDSKYNNIDEWLEKDESVRQGNGLETKVASVSGRKVAMGSGREIVGFIDGDKVLYTFDKQPDGDDGYWNEIFARLLSSFKLKALPGESQESFNSWMSDFNTQGADVVESVETIE